MVKAIVFDFDGVLVDSEPLHFAALLEVGASFRARFDYQHYVRHYIGFDDRDAFREMLREAGKPVDEQTVADLCARKEAVFDRLARDGAKSIPGAVALVDAVANLMPVAIASGATRHDIDLMLRSLGRADKFPIIVSADDVPQSKPDPTSYQLAVQKLAAANPSLDLKPGDCLAIEDTAAGIRSARTAGLMTLGVLTTAPDAADLHEAHRVVESLGEVTPDRIRQWFG